MKRKQNKSPPIGTPLRVNAYMFIIINYIFFILDFCDQQLIRIDFFQVMIIFILITLLIDAVQKEQS